MSESIRILIAEDNALLRGVLRDALAEAGMTVVAEASDGAEAVALAEETTPDVVVMEATERIAQSLWAMTVVVLSAYDEPQMIEAALTAGATSCLKKGVGLDELIEAIRAARRS